MFRCSYNSSFSLMNVQEEMYVVGVILDLWLRCNMMYDVYYYQVWYCNFLLRGICSRLCNLNIDEICKLKIWAKKWNANWNDPVMWYGVSCDLKSNVIKLCDFKTNVIDIWHEHINVTKHGLRCMVFDTGFFVICVSQVLICDINFIYYDKDEWS